MFNFLQDLLGYLISRKRLDFPLASLSTAGPNPPRWRSMTHTTSPVPQRGPLAKVAQSHAWTDRGRLKPEILREKWETAAGQQTTPCKQSCHITDGKNWSDEEERKGEGAGWVAWFQAPDPDT